MTRKEDIYEVLKDMYILKKEGVRASDIANHLNIDRSNISTYLNQLCDDKLVKKIKSRPVYFIPIENQIKNMNNDCFNSLIGKRHSLKSVVEKSKAAILYPPIGLHTILYGETGVGKSMLAEYMYNYSIESKIRVKNSPFIVFNCADYASNPQLLMGHIFGVEKGAYTGADSSRKGLLEVANKGILFLDEIHRLPPEGQEMLFTFIDKGVFKKLGNADNEIKSEVLIIAATTENPDSTLLDTFNRRIPMSINIPALRDRTLIERIELIKVSFKVEAKRIDKHIKVHDQIINTLLLYECKNNIGQLQSDIKLAIATAYLDYTYEKKDMIEVKLKHFSDVVKKTCDNYRIKKQQIEMLKGRKIDYYLFKPDGNIDIVILKEIDEENLVKPQVIEDKNNYNKFYDSMFKEKRFFNLCERVIAIIETDINIVVTQSKFYTLASYLKNTIDNKENLQKPVYIDVNEIKKNYKNEFKIALKILNLIESEYDVFISIEEVANIALFIDEIKNTGTININNIDIVIAMHGENTADSMAKVVKDIVGECNIYAYNTKVNEKYDNIVSDFKNIIKTIDSKSGILLLTDMQPLDSLKDIIKKEFKYSVKHIPRVSTLMAIEAAQKSNLGLSLSEIYDSMIYSNQYN